MKPFFLIFLDSLKYLNLNSLIELLELENIKNFKKFPALGLMQIGDESFLSLSILAMSHLWFLSWLENDLQSGILWLIILSDQHGHMLKNKKIFLEIENVNFNF